MGARLRYRDIDALSLALAGWLQQQGLVKGDRVAVMMPWAFFSSELRVAAISSLNSPRKRSEMLSRGFW